MAGTGMLVSGRGRAKDGTVLGIAVKRRGFFRLGTWVALAAAYALVLNAVLATSLLAATPTAPLGNVAVLCVAHPDGPAADPAGDGAAARVVHCCKLCLQGLAAGLPPPVAPDMFARIAIDGPRQFAFVARLEAYARFVLYSPRGPPAGI